METPWPAPIQDVSFRAEAQMLEAFCEALGLDEVDLVANDSACAIAQIFAVRHPQRLRSLTLTNGDTHDNYPPADFAPTIAPAAAGGLSQQRETLAANPELLRGAFAGGYEHIGNISAETLATYVTPLFATPEATRNLPEALARCLARQHPDDRDRAEAASAEGADAGRLGHGR